VRERGKGKSGTEINQKGKRTKFEPERNRGVTWVGGAGIGKGVRPIVFFRLSRVFSS
jgi:hypothetical protein